jgi:hypothetical protein
MDKGKHSINRRGVYVLAVKYFSGQKYDNTYRPHVEWANIKYQFTPDFMSGPGRR